MASDRSAPPVVAVVVTSRPGPWLDETLSALGSQDYPNLSVLVVDATGGDSGEPGCVSLARRVGACLPSAYLRRSGEPSGYAAGANQAMSSVEGASHLLLCHDDAAPAPDAVRLLVEEAYRSNAGIVAPKLVDWEHPERLLAVGASIDSVGTLRALVERGELDQGQHDAARDVFVAPGGALLVRNDLFAVLGGYDQTLPQGGEDVELSWRALVAGARVRVAPTARVRHLEAHGCGLPDTFEDRVREDRWRWDVLLRCASATTLTWALPTALAYATAEAVVGLFTGRAGLAFEVLRAPWRPLCHPRSLWRARRLAQRRRAVHDHRLRELQTRGSGRLRAWLDDLSKDSTRSVGRPGGRRGLGSGADGRGATCRTLPAPAGTPAPAGLPGPAEVALAPAGVSALAGSPAPVDAAPAAGPATTGVGLGGGVRPGGGWGPAIVSALALVVVLLLGSRGLLTHQIPAIGSLPDTAGGVGRWWHAWLSTWQPAGLGSPGSSPPALGLLTVAGALLFGDRGVLQHVVVLGPLVVGPLGAYRLARPWGSRRAPAVALVAYAACPLAYDALARGRWEALVAYAAAPWTVAALCRLSGSLPHPSLAARRWGGGVVGLGLLVAVASSLVPSWLVVVTVVAGALALGSLLVGERPVATRLVVVGAAGAVLSGVLLLPWSAGVVTHVHAFFGPGPGPGAAPSFARLARFGVGPVGRGPLSWGLLVAATLPLVVGRSWRLAWAVRLWTLVLISLAWAYLAGVGALAAPPVDVLLAPAATGLSGAVALGVAAFEQDLPGYRFGWRQAVSGVAAAGLAVTLLPVLADSIGGRWQLPTTGPSAVLSSLDRGRGGDYRVLWVGAPAALPLASSPLGPGRSWAWATSFDGLPDLTGTWSGGPAGGAAVVAADLRLARQGLTTRLGRLLAPLGVRYIVVPRADAPSGSGAAAVGVPSALVQRLALQTDLEAVGADPNYLVYSNASWLPVRAEVAGGAALPSRPSDRELVASSLGPARPALTGVHSAQATGKVSGGERIYVAATYQPGWRLVVDHRSLRPVRALGVGMSWTIPAGISGRAVLRPGAGSLRLAAQWLIAGLWAVAITLAVVAGRGRRGERRRGGGHGEAVDQPPHRRPPRSTRGSRIEAPVGVGLEEAWGDDGSF